MRSKRDGHRFEFEDALNWKTLFPAYASERARAQYKGVGEVQSVFEKRKYQVCPICNMAVVSPSSHLRASHDLPKEERQGYLTNFRESEIYINMGRN